MKTLYTICYVSKGLEHLKNDDIKNIFDVTVQTNNASGVSGILLYSFGNFFQVLEGEKNTLEPLYENKIMKDTRHSDIYEVFRKEMETPVFSNYLSQFQTITTSVQLDEIRKYLNSNRTHSTSEKLSRLLKPFIIFD